MARCFISKCRFPALYRALVVSTAVACDDDRGPVQPSPNQRIDPARLLLWTAPGTKATARPVVDQDRVYLLDSFNGHVVSALDKRTGTLLWKRNLVFQQQLDALDSGFGLALVNGTLVVSDNELFGLDPVTGAVRWHESRVLSRGLGMFSRFTADQHTVYPAQDAMVWAFDAATGAQRWATNATPGHRAVYFMPQVHEGTVFAAFRWLDNGTMSGAAAIEAATGRLLWTRYFPHTDQLGPDALRVAVTDSLVIVPVMDGKAYVLGRADGHVVRVLPRSHFYPKGNVPALPGENYVTHYDARAIFVGGNAGQLTALDPGTLVPRWSSPGATGSGLNDISTDDAFVYVAEVGGVLSVYDRFTGELAWYVRGYELESSWDSGTLRAPASDGERVYMGGFGKASYAFRRHPN